MKYDQSLLQKKITFQIVIINVIKHELSTNIYVLTHPFKKYEIIWVKADTLVFLF